MLEKESNSRQEEKGRGVLEGTPVSVIRGRGSTPPRGRGDPGGWAPRILSHLVFFFGGVRDPRAGSPPCRGRTTAPIGKAWKIFLGHVAHWREWPMARGGSGVSFTASARDREAGHRRPWVRLESSVERVRPLGAPLMLSELDARQRSWFAGWPRDKRAGPWPNGALAGDHRQAMHLAHTGCRKHLQRERSLRGRIHSACVACQRGGVKRGLAVSRHDGIPASKAPSGSWPGERRASLPE